VAIAAVFTVLWIVRRDRWAVRVRDFFEAGRQARAGT
jgi:hypothetical protein